MWMRGARLQALAVPVDRERLADLPVPVADVGRFWSDMVLTGAEQLERLEPGRLLQLGYEALVADPAMQVERLAAFIGVEADREWMRRAGALVEPRPRRWKELPADEQAALTEALRARDAAALRDGHAGLSPEGSRRARRGRAWPSSSGVRGGGT